MTLPHLMCKIWDGDPNEYFTWLDMNRVEYNANALATEAGVPNVEFIEVQRKHQFRYDEAQKLENLLAAVASKIGVAIRIEEAWGYNRTVSFADFERWESNFWMLYTTMGGIGERIPAGKILITYSATLFADAWKGTGPYYHDLVTPGIMTDTDVLAYVAHIATLEQRVAEYDATLKPQIVSDRHIRIWALSVKPDEDLPIRLSIGGFHLHQVINLPASGWQGSGPWTQTATLTTVPVNAVIGAHEGMSDAQVLEMANAIISVSAINGKTITVRAIESKPTIDLNPAVMWETSEAE